MKFKTFILSLIVGVLIAMPAHAQIGGGNIGPGDFWKKVGTALFPRTATWELGSSSSRIQKIWAQALDIVNITIGGIVTGNLQIGGIATSTITGDGTTSTIGGALGVNTTTANFPLDVNGIINSSVGLYVGGVPYVGSQWTTAGSNIYYTTGNVGIGTTTIPDRLTVAGNTYLQGDLRSLNNEYYFNSSTGAFDIGYLRTGNLNFEENAGLVSSHNMSVTTTAATPMGVRMIGFNDEYLIGSYTEAATGGNIDYSKLRLGFFPELPWGGLNNLGGWNLLATTTQTYSTATATLYTFSLGATSSMGFTCAISASDILTNTSSYYRLIFAAKRSNSGEVSKVGVDSITAFEEDATWNAFTSTTATGIAVNVVGGAATTSWKGACEMLKIEP